MQIQVSGLRLHRSSHIRMYVVSYTRRNAQKILVCVCVCVYIYIHISAYIHQRRVM